MSDYPQQSYFGAYAPVPEAQSVIGVTSSTDARTKTDNHAIPQFFLVANVRLENDQLLATVKLAEMLTAQGR